MLRVFKRISVCVGMYCCNLPQWSLYSKTEGLFIPQIESNFLFGAKSSAFFNVKKSIGNSDITSFCGLGIK